MIVLLDTSEDLRRCATEIGCPVEQLLTPLTGFTAHYPEDFAILEAALTDYDNT